MLDHSDILKLVPHQGRMCLLDQIERWSAEDIVCSAVSHLDPTNPLRSRGRLAPVCGVEYGLQAAAAHGALMDGSPQTAGFLVSLRTVRFSTDRLDNPTYERLIIRAVIPVRERRGLVVEFTVAAAGRELLGGRASIYLPETAAPPA